MSSIEPITEEFIDDVVSLEDGIPDFPTRSFQENIQRIENYRRWVESWVVKYKPERIQLCFVDRVNSPVAYSWIEPNSKHEVELHSLVVRKAFRRRGIGTQFLRELFKRFWNDGFATVLLGVAKENTSAVKLYKKLGFDITKEDEVFYDVKLRLETLFGEK